MMEGICFPCTIVSRTENMTIFSLKCCRSCCCALTFDVINLIGPWSTFTIRLASRRFAIFVKRLGSRSTGCTPSTILNCENVESSLLSCLIAFFDGVVPCLVAAIQDGILSFYCWYSAATTILETSDCFVSKRRICENRFGNVSSMYLQSILLCKL